MIDNLYRFFPRATYHILCWHPMISFYESFGLFERVIPCDLTIRNDQFALFMLQPKIDLYIDLQHTIGSARLAAVTKAKIRVGVNPHKDTHHFYTHVIVPHKGEQIKECFLRGFQELFLEKEIDPDMPLPIQEKHRKTVRVLLDAHQIHEEDAYVIIHPGAKGKEKLWNVEKWCELVCFFYEEGYRVILVGSHLLSWGGAEILDLSLCEAIGQRVPKRCFNFVGCVKDFMVLAALIEGAAYYCGLDTGPTHLAAMTGVPVMELYKYRNEETFALWRPYRGNVSIIARDNLDDIAAGEVCALIRQNLKTKTSVTEHTK